MIKGCNKRVIVMKDTGHDMIEEAFFILKPEAAKGTKLMQSDGDILMQANMILDAKGIEAPFSGVKLNVNTCKTKTSAVTPFLWGMVLGMVLTCIIVAVAV